MKMAKLHPDILAAITKATRDGTESDHLVAHTTMMRVDHDHDPSMNTVEIALLNKRGDLSLWSFNNMDEITEFCIGLKEVGKTIFADGTSKPECTLGKH